MQTPSVPEYADILRGGLMYKNIKEPGTCPTTINGKCTYKALSNELERVASIWDIFVTHTQLQYTYTCILLFLVFAIVNTYKKAAFKRRHHHLESINLTCNKSNFLVWKTKT